VLGVDGNGNFEPNRALTGAELVDAAARLEGLAGAGVTPALTRSSR
jgi:hypothetical protein